MAQTISIPDALHQRLADMALFGGCDEAEVIRRLLDGMRLRATQETALRGRVALGRTELPSREPRERGAVVEIDGVRTNVDSVRDLYEQALRYLIKSGKRDLLRSVLPVKTSSRRYLIADRPRHPSGKAFFVPIEHGGFFMETHKSYRAAIGQLSDLLNKLGVSFRYIE